MHKKTYDSLLGLGFDTDIIARIDKHGHTLSALRNLSKRALAADYTENEIALIQEKIQRIPIPPDVVEAALACFCASSGSFFGTVW